MFAAGGHDDIQVQLGYSQVLLACLALSPALLSGDMDAWAADVAVLTASKDVAYRQGHLFATVHCPSASQALEHGKHQSYQRQGDMSSAHCMPQGLACTTSYSQHRVTTKGLACACLHHCVLSVLEC